MAIMDSLGLGGLMGGWFGILFYLGLGVCFFVFVGVGGIIIRRKRKLVFPVLEITGLGGGKAGIKKTWAGWFRSNWILGLIDYGGELRLLTKDKREIQLASSDDFHEINGKRGLVVQRKGDDPKILVPINKIELDDESKKLLNSIAPADYRDASVKLVTQAERETMSKFSQYVGFIAVGVIFIFAIIVIIFTIQYVKHAQAEAWGFTMESVRGAGARVSDVVEGTAPLILALPRKLFGRRK